MLSQSDPDKNSAVNMVSLNSPLSALALFNPSELLEISVKLLNLPSNGTHLLCITRRILRQVIGIDEIRAVF